MKEMPSDLTEQFRQENPEVYYAPPGFVAVGDAEIDWLIARAATLPRRRSRLCLHKDPQAQVHDMLIVHHRSCYVRPHRHFSRSETLSVLRGTATAITFDEVGAVGQLVLLGPAGSGCISLYRMPPQLFHGLVVDSEWLVFLETTAGPYDAQGSEFAPWSPDGKNDAETEKFTQALRLSIAAA